MDFVCSMCKHDLSSIFLLRMHCFNVHPGAFFTCPWCSSPFGCSEFEDHTTNCLKFNENEPRESEFSMVLVDGGKCLLCEGRFSSNEAAIRHQKEHHLNVAFVCKFCRRFFQRYHSWDFHRKKCQMGASTVSLILSAPTIHRTTFVQTNKRAASKAFDEIDVAGPSLKRSTNRDNNGKDTAASAMNANEVVDQTNSASLTRYCRSPRLSATMDRVMKSGSISDEDIDDLSCSLPLSRPCSPSRQRSRLWSQLLSLSRSRSPINLGSDSDESRSSEDGQSSGRQQRSKTEKMILVENIRNGTANPSTQKGAHSSVQVSREHKSGLEMLDEILTIPTDVIDVEKYDDKPTTSTMVLGVKSEPVSDDDIEVNVDFLPTSTHCRVKAKSTEEPADKEDK